MLNISRITIFWQKRTLAVTNSFSSNLGKIILKIIWQLILKGPTSCARERDNTFFGKIRLGKANLVSIILCYYIFSHSPSVVPIVLRAWMLWKLRRITITTIYKNIKFSYLSVYKQYPAHSGCQTKKELFLSHMRNKAATTTSNFFPQK